MTYWEVAGVYLYGGSERNLEQFGFAGVINDTDIRYYKDSWGKFKYKSGDYLLFQTSDTLGRGTNNYFRFDTVKELQGNINTEIAVTYYFDRDTDSYLEIVENSFRRAGNANFYLEGSVGAIVKRESGVDGETIRISTSTSTNYIGLYSYIEGRYEYSNGDFYSVKGFILDEFGGGDSLWSSTEKVVLPSTSAKDSFIEIPGNSTGRYIIDPTKSFYKAGNRNDGIEITSFYEHSSGKLHAPTSITLGSRGLGSESAVFNGENGNLVSIDYGTLAESRI